MRFIVLLSSLFISLPLAAQINVNVSLDKKQYLSFEAVRLTLNLGNRSGNPLTLKNTASNNWIEFIVRNQNGRVVSKVKPTRFNGMTLPVAENVKSTFIINNIYDITEPGNYSVMALIRTANQDRDRGTFSPKCFFTVNRGVPQWKTRVGVPGVAGDQREYRIFKHSANKTPEIYVQVEDVKRGYMLATYSMGRLLAFGKPQKAIDRANNLHVLFHTTPDLYCRTVVATSGKTIKRDYYKSIGRSHPSLTNSADGGVDVFNGVLYDPNQQIEEKAKYHNLSDMPPGF